MNKIILNLLQRNPEYKVIISCDNYVFDFVIKRGDGIIYSALDTDYDKLIADSIDYFVGSAVSSYTVFEMSEKSVCDEVSKKEYEQEMV